MRKFLVPTALLFFAGLQAIASDKEDKKVDVKRKLRTGIVAVGGETTGTIVETKDGTFELEFGKDRDLRDKAEKLNGKMVHVQGTLTIRPGVEVKERKIIAVSRLEEDKEK